MSDRVRLVLVVLALEFASGMPYGVVNDLVPVWLRVHGMGLAELGALTLVGLPWTLKPLWAPLIDSFGTWQRWMAGGLLVATVATAGLLALPPELLVPFLVLIAFASATQDIAVDGYLVARVPPSEHGRVNGARVAAYRGAMALAGGGAVWVGDRFGWPWAFGVVAAFQLACVAFEAGTAPAPRATPVGAGRFFATLASWLTDPARLPLFAFFLLFKLGDSAMAPMVKPFLLTRMDAGSVGLLSSTAGAVLIAVGAVIGGEIASRVPLGRALLVLGLGQACSNLVYAGAATAGGVGAAVVASVTESFTSGLGTAGTMALAMRGARGAQGATRFAVLSSVIGLTRTLSGAISGVAVEHLGYADWFTLTFFLALPGLFLVGAAVRAVHDPDDPASPHPARP